MTDNQNIIYELGGGKRPSNSLLQKVLMKMCNMPFLNKIRYIHDKFCEKYGIPKTTSLSKGFYCSAANLEIGECTGLGDTHILAYAKVKIGRNCSFSFRNMIITSTHDYKDFGTVIAKPITIGDNVWVTSNVTILPGVTIGNNTVIGAGSVVTRDIPAGVFAAGNPCKVIKEIRFKK